MADSEEPRAPAERAPEPGHDLLESPPDSVRCPALALQQLQKRCDKIEAKFEKEFQALEKKYNDIYKPLLAKIHELAGEMEGCAWTLAGEGEDDEDAASHAAAGASAPPCSKAPRSEREIDSSPYSNTVDFKRLRF
ncbi:nucleosome assembly protein 1-like 5 [Erethizon dorsatum]